ncbi:hypothetical protein [Desulfuribacillus stibiiarsenatis]|nr:hypothetical protein [Desulfuribacillus stibiiarsenatis]
MLKVRGNSEMITIGQCVDMYEEAGVATIGVDGQVYLEMEVI